MKGFHNFDVEENRTFVRGLVDEELVFDHASYEEKFYKTKVKVRRISGTVDYVPVMITERLLSPKDDLSKFKGRAIEIIGQIRTYDIRDEKGKNHLIIYLFALEIYTYREEEFDSDNLDDANNVYLVGNICRAPVFRKTPLKRTICDLMLVVLGKRGKTYYVPCIVWGKNACNISKCDVGTRVEILGRIQSREYFKRISPDSEEGETRVTYEVSAININVM